MKQSFLTSILIVFSIFTISSCSSPVESTENLEAPIKDVVKATNEAEVETVEEVIETPAKWYLIEGTMGLYTSSIVMELNILNGEVRGRYFYAKHQKYLTLNGTIDKSGEVQLKESYKGEITGYLNFTLSDKIKGTWKAKPESEDLQKIEARQITSISQEHYNPKFSVYEYAHTTSIYNGPDQEPDVYDVIDRMSFNTLSDSLAIFHYAVTGANGHSGSIEGIAKNIDGIWTFYGEEECKLTIEFDGKQANIDEDECWYYRGARAYFQNTLQKVK